MTTGGFNLHALKEFASATDPSSLGPSTLLKYTAFTITVFDKYPKAKYHFLILPRIDPKVAHRTTSALHDLRSLLMLGPEKAKVVLKELEEASVAVEEMIRDEMHGDHGEGVEWEVMKGFHAVPSMSHLHLHVISSDYVSPSLKTKKHWNSFNPKFGFFLHIKDVMGWLDLPEAALRERIHSTSQSEPLLKDNMKCWKCSTAPSNIPKLKEHLQMHFDRDLAKLKKSRKHEVIDLAGDEDADEIPHKIQKHE
ncbi:hypothetical protein FRB95_011632 [Tulasnella sp. JGI-2019a]|nr:hypothetical protein FRB93_000958 [Tulasnella sp. JGI-2019a]KAG9024338.1 hypothetical protein FRB95_011632 [Tulasnella sp. JGI-2019a]